MSGLYEELRDLLNQEKGAALATIVRGPAHVGAKLLVFANGTTHGTLGLAALEQLVTRDAEKAIWNGDANTHTYTLDTTSSPQTFDIFIEGFPLPHHLLLSARDISRFP
ncbi:XdhC family protein [Ktedonosporobacter rubrisoli]|uniref:XdhC family protein n=1 Tax=Ktedonosporobacter rubrisoli TaxID=2509675 RepID=UPI001A910AF8|nr:XdhC family protein [Ktedonosporobacter rubrisoli]